MFKAATTQSHQVFDSHASRWLAPTAIWLGLAVTGVAASAMIVRHILAEAPQRLTTDPLTVLQPLLDGKDVVVPDGVGFWTQTLSNSQLLTMRANPSGHAQRINLCSQRVQAKDAPNKVYPVALVGSIKALSATELYRDSRHNPLVVAAEDAVGMPTMTISGSAANNPNDSRLDLNVHPSAEPGTWQVAMSGEPSGSGPNKRFDFAHQAWLLWTTESMKKTNAQGEEKKPTFNRAVRIRMVPQVGCSAGALEWQLFTAQDADAQAPASVWVKTSDGSGDVRMVRLGTGTYPVPQNPAPRIEDRVLFEKALAQGLIQLQGNGLAAVAPSDLARIKAMGQDTKPWPAGNQLGSAELATLKALHQTDNGQYVKSQLTRFNESQYWLAARYRIASGASATPSFLTNSMASWRADANGESLTLSRGLPPVASRLFDAPPVGWSEWQRIAAPKGASTNDVILRVPFASLSAEALVHGIELLVLGQLRDVSGAVVIAREANCNGPGCVAQDMLQRVTLKAIPGQTSIEISLRPEPRFNALKPAAAEQMRVQTQSKGGTPQLTWVDPSSGHETTHLPAEVSITARDGTTLFDGETATAQALQMGLGSLMGLSRNHDSSLAGSLMRLGQLGDAKVVARTTIDPTLQRIANAVLSCIAQQDGHWDSQKLQCNLQKTSIKIDARRSSNAVVMDAANGDILVAASGAPLPKDVLIDELIAFDRFNPSASVLTPGAWSHDGGVSYGAGSGFKIVSALSLEVAAQRDSALLQLLNGASPATWNSIAAKAGQSFRMDSACFPQPCGGRQPHVTNFRNARPMDQQVNGQFGVVQALKASVNTWFAYMAERTDLTVPSDNADVRPLGFAALHTERPILDMAHRLGFERPLRLDGGLLPNDFSWRAGDYLQTVPSRFDAIDHVHGVRQIALGLRMQVTPLQMARVAASVATGIVPTPRLMLQLNQRESSTSTGESLDVPLQRVREGMKEVVNAGTAKGAFQGADLKRLGVGVFGKTGTAPIPGTDLNSAWFVGYILPKTLPGEQRTLAFAVQVRYSPITGGAHAAPVIAQLIETLSHLSNQTSVAQQP